MRGRTAVAIGSQPTIGDTFSTRDDFESEEALWEWYALWREQVGPDLLGGYAKLDYPEKYKPMTNPQTEE